MGLDQYAFLTTTAEVEAANNTEGVHLTEDFYWRKHNRLQVWMENLWNSKGNTGTFNCVDVELTEDDLVALQRDIEEWDNYETKGFYFGNGSHVDYRDPDYGYYERDKQFVEAALAHVRKGNLVLYSSWW